MMVKFIGLVVLILLSGCGNSDSGGAPPCSPSKEVFSTWTSRESGAVYDMSNCAFGVNCQVLFGSGSCDDNRGDFTIFVESDGRLGLSNCADTASIDGANWSIDCSNTLVLEYDSDKNIERFD